MAQMIYGRGGLGQIPTVVEKTILAQQGATIVTTAERVITSPDLPVTGSLAGVAVGAVASGLGIPDGATVLALDDAAHTATLSGNATANEIAATPITFRNPTTPGMQPSKVILFTNVISPSYKALTVGDLVEATYDGYAPSSDCVWSAPLVDPNGNAFITADKKQFVCTGNSVEEAITGAALVSSDGLTLQGVDKFLNADGTPAPVAMAAAGNGFDYVPTLSLKAGN